MISSRFELTSCNLLGVVTTSEYLMSLGLERRLVKHNPFSLRASAIVAS